MLAKAGVKFAFYSDGVDSAPDLKKAIKKAIDAGLPRADAIRALTLNARRDSTVYRIVWAASTKERSQIWW